MPLAKIHVVEGRYDEARIAKVSGAVQAALMNTLRVPPSQGRAGMVVTPGISLCEFAGASRLNQDLIAKRFGSGAICESMTWIRQALHAEE